MKKMLVVVVVFFMMFGISVYAQDAPAKSLDSDKAKDAYKNLLNAARLGNIDEIKKLISENKTLVNATQYSDMKVSPLLFASLEGHLDVVKFLVASGADLNAQDSKFGMTPLLCAIMDEHSEVATYLLKAGADVNKVNLQGRNALHYAVHTINEDIVRQLLDAGVNTETVDYENRTPLGVAQRMFVDKAILPEDKSRLQTIMTLIRESRTAHPKVVPNAEMRPIRERIRLSLKRGVNDKYKNKIKEALRLFLC